MHQIICIGHSAAQLSTENYQTICIGNEAGYNSGGNWNIYIGHSAGYSNLNSDTNNVFIGHGLSGTPGESNTIKLGKDSSRCLISGIYDNMSPTADYQTITLQKTTSITTDDILTVYVDVDLMICKCTTLTCLLLFQQIKSQKYVYNVILLYL
jgi:hypothetical protein